MEFSNFMVGFIFFPAITANVKLNAVAGFVTMICIFYAMIIANSNDSAYY